LQSKQIEVRQEGMVHWKLLVLCLALMAIDPWIPSGRLRFYSTASGTLLLGAGALWWYLGWSTPKVDEGTRSTPMNLGVRRSVHFAEQPRSADLLLHEHAGLPPLESLSGPIDVGHIPPGAPPVPSTEQQAGVLTAANEMLPTAELAAGSRIRLISVSPYVSLAGQAGVIETTNSGKCNIKLDTGLGLKDVPFTALVRETGVEETAVAAMGASTVFAPYATTGHTTKLQAQASRLKDALTKAAALNSTVPSWATLFWQAVKNERDIYSLEPETWLRRRRHERASANGRAQEAATRDRDAWRTPSWKRWHLCTSCGCWSGQKP